MKNNEWISVKDRLPEKNGRYLVVVDDGCGSPYVDRLWFAKRLSLIPSFTYSIIEDNNRPGFYYRDTRNEWEIPYVSHWMELPELPEEVKRNDG